MKTLLKLNKKYFVLKKTSKHTFFIFTRKKTNLEPVETLKTFFLRTEA
jgi:hypothetical protein